MQLHRLIACTWLAAASVACSHYQDPISPTDSTPGMLVGSGRVITGQRPASDFTSIAISSGISAVVAIGGAESLTITAEDNIAPFVDAVVSSGQLTIRFRSGSPGLRTSVGVVCHIGARALRRVDLSGGSRIQVDGLAAPDFFVGLSGGSSFSASGSVDRLQMDLSGGSRATAPSLRCGRVDATVSGAALGQVRVTDTLVVHASGASTFEYLGDPTVQADVSDVSVVRRVGA